MASFVLPIISGLAGLFGGGQQQKQQQNTNSSTTSNQNQTSTSTPNLSPFQQQLVSLFTGGAQDLYNKDANISPYITQGLQTIGHQGDANRQILSNIAASRGLSYSPAGSQGQIANVINTGNQASQFRSQAPLLQRQLQMQGLDELMKAFGVQPTSVTNTGSSSGTSNTVGTGTSTTSGNPVAGALGGFGAGLATAFPGIFGPKKTGGGGGTGLGTWGDFGGEYSG